MRKTILLAFIMVFSLSASTFALAGPKSPKNLSQIENKLSEKEVSRYTKRVEEIRDMDRKSMTSKDKMEMRNELKDIKENLTKNGGVIYLSAGTLILIIILVILLV
jgi:hypothetical protein